LAKSLLLEQSPKKLFNSWAFGILENWSLTSGSPLFNLYIYMSNSIIYKVPAKARRRNRRYVKGNRSNFLRAKIIHRGLSVKKMLSAWKSDYYEGLYSSRG
jgi:hypothetical protein